MHCYTEVKKDGAWQFHAKDWPFVGRNSVLFGFLGHRHCFPNSYLRIGAPRGLPQDLSREMLSAAIRFADDDQYVYKSWVTLRELLDFDYEQVIYRERVIIDCLPGTDELSYSAPSNDDEGEWKDFTLRDEIGVHFPEMLRSIEEELGAPDNIRITYWFDQEWSYGQSRLTGSYEIQSDDEVQKLNAEWTAKLALLHAARADGSPAEVEIQKELDEIGRQRTQRWEVLLGFDPEPEVDTIPTN